MKTLADVLTNLAPHAKNFDYSTAEYTGALKPITGIRCAEHGKFQQYAAQLKKLGGAGCPKCGKVKRGIAKRATAGEMLCMLRHVHGTLYTYPILEDDLTAKPGTAQPIICGCAVHGRFEANYSNLLSGKGCPACGALKRGRYTKVYQVAPQAQVAALRKSKRRETLLLEFVQVHQDRYDYSKFEYGGMRTAGVIICSTHGEFTQAPMKHLGGQGCPHCSHRVSKQETEIAEWLRSKGLIVEQQNRQLIAPAELDIWLPERRLAIEFNGAHWHADDRPRKNTMRVKHHALALQGIRLISIFDFEWHTRRNAVENILQAATGQQQSIGARKITVRAITPAESRKFLDQWHIAGFVAGKCYLGLFYNDRLVGVATFGQSRFESGVFELLRYATDCHVIGGLQKTIKAARAMLNFKRLVSYCDLRYGTGQSYAKAGFKLASITPPDYWWFKGNSHFSRYQTQRHKLAKHAEFAPFYASQFTEREICEAAGYRKISGIGHQKWVLDIK